MWTQNRRCRGRMILLFVVFWFFFLISIICFLDLFFDFVPTPSNNRLESYLIGFYIIEMFVIFPIGISYLFYLGFLYITESKLIEWIVWCIFEFWTQDISNEQILITGIIFSMVSMVLAFYYMILSPYLAERPTCSKCKAKNKRKAKYCSKCGGKLC